MFKRNALLEVVVVITCLLRSVCASVGPPNIVVILADDLGWNDVSFHGSNQYHTPNIDALAYNGVILNSLYVPALCTPSRASFLTGKYPTTLGMQHLVIMASEARGLPLEETLMPQYLKRQGYATHAIGKWHLGFFRKEYTPTFRGFDTHFGYWNGFQDYYDHTTHAGGYKGYDMRRGMDVDFSSMGKYSTDIFTEEAVRIIKEHNSTQGPMFLYLAHLAPHSGNPDKPLQAPQEEVNKHLHIKDPDRRIYAAMVTRADDSVGKIMKALKTANMLDNSIVLFMADNGGVTQGIYANRASNYPLRGLKESPWEGGIRAAAAIWSPLLNKTKRVSHQLMHMSDWLPTLYAAAGFNTSDLGKIEGLNVWDALSYDTESPRKEVFHNHDELEKYSSAQVGTWKIVEGAPIYNEYDEWYGDSGKEDGLVYDPSMILDSDTNKILTEHLKEDPEASESDKITRETILRLRSDSELDCEYATLSAYGLITGNHTRQPEDAENEPFVFDSVVHLEEATKEVIDYVENIRRKYPPLGKETEKFTFSPKERSRIAKYFASGKLRRLFKCDSAKSKCLFNIATDPCERVNLAALFPRVLRSVEKRLTEMKKTVMYPQNQKEDPLSDPALYNYIWTNWRDIQELGNADTICKDDDNSFGSDAKKSCIFT